MELNNFEFLAFFLCSSIFGLLSAVWTTVRQFEALPQRLILTTPD